MSRRIEFHGAAFWLVMTAILGCAAWMVPGCNLFDSHVKQMDLLRGLGTDAAQRLRDGTGQMQVSGSAQNPGIKVEASITYSAKAGYDGMAGQFAVSSQGDLGDREMSESIMAIINDASLSDRQRTEIIRDLLSRLARPTTSQPSGAGP